MRAFALFNVISRSVLWEFRLCLKFPVTVPSAILNLKSLTSASPSLFRLKFVVKFFALIFLTWILSASINALWIIT